MKVQQAVEMKLVNFRVPYDMKDAFWKVCKYNGTDMSRVLTGMVREYINEEVPKLNQYKLNASTMGDLMPSHKVTASKSTKKDGWYDDIENDETPTQRRGQWVLNPHSKTWEMG
jgi:antitoxin component of RelBE/YafQ-DinJ toxin-antitoxin module